MKNSLKALVAATTLLAGANAMAATETVNVNVNFLEAITITVDQHVDYGSIELPAADTDNCVMDIAGAIAGPMCPSGALGGSVPAVGLITVTASAGANVDISSITTPASGLDFTPSLFRADTTPVALPGTIAALASEQFTMGGDLVAVTAASVPTGAVVLNVDFTVAYQ